VRWRQYWTWSWPDPDFNSLQTGCFNSMGDASPLSGRLRVEAASAGEQAGEPERGRGRGRLRHQTRPKKTTLIHEPAKRVARVYRRTATCDTTLSGSATDQVRRRSRQTGARSPRVTKERVLLVIGEPIQHVLPLQNLLPEHLADCPTGLREGLPVDPSIVLVSGPGNEPTCLQPRDQTGHVGLVATQPGQGQSALLGRDGNVKIEVQDL